MQTLDDRSSLLLRYHHEHSSSKLLDDPWFDVMHGVEVPFQQAVSLQEPLLAYVAFLLMLLLLVLAKVVGVEELSVAYAAFNHMDLA